MDPAQQPSCCEELVQVDTLWVQTVAVLEAIAEVVELRLGQCRTRTQNHLLQGRRQVGLQSHVNPHSAQAEQDGHLDKALGEVFL